MRMTASTIDGQPQHRGTQNLQLIRNHLQTVRHKRRDVGKRTVRCRSQKTCGHQIVVKLLSHLRGSPIICQLIPRQLLMQKTVVRFVCIESLNNVVAVTPHVRTNAVFILSPLGVRVAGRIQPVLPPANSILRRLQQLINQPRNPVRTRILQHLLHLLPCRRQSRQIKVQATHQHRRIRRLRKRQTRLLQPLQHKVVHRRLHPPPTGH